jgi:hypothetical protein
VDRLGGHLSSGPAPAWDHLHDNELCRVVVDSFAFTQEALEGHFAGYTGDESGWAIDPDVNPRLESVPDAPTASAELEARGDVRDVVAFAKFETSFAAFLRRPLAAPLATPGPPPLAMPPRVAAPLGFEGQAPEAAVSRHATALSTFRTFHNDLTAFCPQDDQVPLSFGRFHSFLSDCVNWSLAHRDSLVCLRLSFFKYVTESSALFQKSLEADAPRWGCTLTQQLFKRATKSLFEPFRAFMQFLLAPPPAGSALPGPLVTAFGEWVDAMRMKPEKGPGTKRNRDDLFLTNPPGDIWLPHLSATLVIHLIRAGLLNGFFTKADYLIVFAALANAYRVDAVALKNPRRAVHQSPNKPRVPDAADQKAAVMHALMRASFHACRFVLGFQPQPCTADTFRERLAFLARFPRGLGDFDWVSKELSLKDVTEAKCQVDAGEQFKEAIKADRDKAFRVPIEKSQAAIAAWKEGQVYEVVFEDECPVFQPAQ